MLGKPILLCLFIVILFTKNSPADCTTDRELTDSVFDVIYDVSQSNPIGTAFLIDDENKLFLTAKHVLYQQASQSNNDKKLRLRSRNQQEIVVDKIVLAGGDATKKFKRLMGDWALLKGQKSSDDLELPAPLPLHISRLTGQTLLTSGVYQNRSASNTSMIDWGRDVQPVYDPKVPIVCSRDQLRMLKIENYDKGYSGSPVITRNCTVAALTSSFSDGEDFSGEEQEFLAEKYLELRKQLEAQNGTTPNDLNNVIYKFVTDEQLVKVVPLACIMHSIIEARFYDKIPLFESSNKKLETYLRKINNADINNSLINTINDISADSKLTWTEFVEIENAFHHHKKDISVQDKAMLLQVLIKRESTIDSDNINLSFDMVSDNNESPQNINTQDLPKSSQLSAKQVADILISNANETKITAETLPQVIPEESEIFGKDLTLEDNIKIAKKLEDYLTGRIPWPAKAKPDFKRLVADTALSHAASAYRTANTSQDQSVIADSLEIIGTIINYGSQKEVLSEERYRQKANVGNVIYLNAEMVKFNFMF